jgi:hypothetical protein
MKTNLLSTPLFIALFFIIYTAPSYSQFKLGLEAGVSSSTFHEPDKSPLADISSISGLTIGGILNYEITNFLSVQIEPRYTEKGETINKDTSLSQGFHLGYLELPISVVAGINIKNFYPFLSFGINYGYLVSAVYDDLITNNEYDIKSIFKKNDLAADFGIGLKYSVDPKSTLMFQTRYSYGIANISNQANSTINTRSLQFIFGFLFNL